MGNNIGRLEIKVPKELEVSIIEKDVNKELILYTNKKDDKSIWSLSIPKNYELKVGEDRTIKINPTDAKKESIALWGTLNSMIKSIMIGKAQGYTLKLGLKGVGYRFEKDIKENTFILHIGLTHPKRINLPNTIVCKLLKNNTILEGKCDNYQELTNNLNRIRLIKPASKDKYSGKGFYLIK